MDPFPERASGPATRGTIDFVTNAKLAATTLPRREVIREDIRQITTMNRRLERLGALQARWETDRLALGKAGAAPQTPQKPGGLENLDLSDLAVKQDMDRTIRCIITFGSTGRRTCCRTWLRASPASPAESGPAAYLRQIVRAWRDSKFTAYWQPRIRTEPGLRSETAFLGGYDLDFRRRRLIHLRQAVTSRLEAAGEDPNGLWAVWSTIEAELARLRRLAHATPADRETLLGGTDAAAIAAALEAGYADFGIQPRSRRQVSGGPRPLRKT